LNKKWSHSYSEWRVSSTVFLLGRIPWSFDKIDKNFIIDDQKILCREMFNFSTQLMMIDVLVYIWNWLICFYRTFKAQLDWDLKIIDKLKQVVRLCFHNRTTSLWSIEAGTSIQIYKINNFDSPFVELDLVCFLISSSCSTC
jgi:hypothetical protein